MKLQHPSISAVRLHRLLPGQAMSMLLAATQLLVLTGCALSQRTVTSETPARASAARPPNIVFIMSDDHAVQAVSAYQHPISQLAPTPNIDRIAQAGVRFTNSFVTNSLCGPSRAAMLTGKLSHINGLRRNGDVFDASQPTWPRALKEAGYQTALFGKWHLAGTPEPLALDDWQILDDQGEYYNPDFITRQGTQRVQGYVTDLITAASLRWLQQERDPDKPFVLLMQHKAPHRNWMPALRHLGRYEHAKFPLPDTYFDDYQGRRAAAAQEMIVHRDMHEGHDLKMTRAVGSTQLRYDPWPQAFGRLTAEQRTAWDAGYQARNDAMNAAEMSEREMALWKYQRYLQDYLGTITAVDESVGAILDYLDEAGLADHTIVIYTSDQGFFLGEHGWFDKRFIYEESLRTPLLIRYPRAIPAGTTVGALVQNIDLASTLLDYAGLDIPADMQGRSLRRLAQSEPTPEWRKSIYYHYYEYPGFHSVRAHYGVRTQRYKLAHFYGDIDAWEFYDLAADPKELNNEIDNPAYSTQIAELRAELAQLRDQYGDRP